MFDYEIVEENDLYLDFPENCQLEQFIGDDDRSPGTLHFLLHELPVLGIQVFIVQQRIRVLHLNLIPFPIQQDSVVV